MSIRTNLFDQSALRNTIQRRGAFSVIEYERDVSVTPDFAQMAYFSSQMNVRKKQLAIALNRENGVYVQAREMQLMVGDIEATTDVKNAGDLLKKVVGSIVTEETIIKPHYSGDGLLVLEPTFKHILLEDLSEWPDGIMTEDGMFLACDDTIYMEIGSRKNISSLLLGREGIFNSVFTGHGILALESSAPREELIEVVLDNDVVKIDGNMAVAWSPELKFTVERSMKTLVGSAVSGEGLVNVYEGTGRVLIAPVRSNRGIGIPDVKP